MFPQFTELIKREIVPGKYTRKDYVLPSEGIRRCLQESQSEQEIHSTNGKER